MNIVNFIMGILNSDEFDGVVRHALTTAGGAVVAAGYATNDQWAAIGGGIAVAITVLWSIANKTFLKNQAALTGAK